MIQRLLATTAILIATAFASAAAAQAPETASTQTQIVGLPEVVVTAQRRSENLQRAAIAVSALSKEALAQAGVTQAQDLTKLVPALTVSVAAGPYNLFYIRGVGSLNGNPLSDSAIAVNLDGVFISRPSSTSGMFFDVERIEVLKGPQGTLYGRNATGGAINIITKKPRIGVYAGDIAVEVGNYDAIKLQGAVNVPLSENSAMRAAFQTAQHEGYMSDGGDDQDEVAARLQYSVEFSDDLRLTLSGDYFHAGGIGAGASLIRGNFVDDRVGNTDPRSNAVYASALFFPAGNVLRPLNPDRGQDNVAYGVAATLDWATPIGDLTVVPAYRRTELDFSTGAPSFGIIQKEEDEQLSLEARLASSGDGALRYIVGAFYLDEDIRAQTRYNNQFNLSNQDYTAPLKSYAVFGRLTYAVTDTFRLTGGLRYTVDDKSLQSRPIVANIICPAALSFGNPVGCIGGPTFPDSMITPPEVITAAALGIPVPYGTRGNLVTAVQLNTNQSEKFEKTTWRVAAEFDVAPSSLLYVSAEEGFKAGGFFFTSDTPTYRPETLIAYTLGSKNRFFDNSLQLNAELFLWKYKDQQVSHISLDSRGTVVFITENVGEATSMGAELDAQLKLTDHTLLQVGLQYLDASYDKFSYRVPNLGSPPVANCPSQAAGLVYVVNCDGKTAPFAPEWTANIGVEQTFPLAVGKVVLRADARYQSEMFTGLEFLDGEVQGSHWITDASITYAAPEDRWSATAFVRNIADEAVVGSTFPHPLEGALLLTGTLRAPRTYGIRVAASF